MNGVLSGRLAGRVPQVLGKILIGLLQITSELPGALALTFPAEFTAILGAMKIFLFDVFEVFKVDCISPLSVHTKFVATMLFPVAGVGMVWLWCCYENAKTSRVLAKVTKRNNTNETKTTANVVELAANADKLAAKVETAKKDAIAHAKKKEYKRQVKEATANHNKAVGLYLEAKVVELAAEVEAAKVATQAIVNANAIEFKTLKSIVNDDGRVQEWKKEEWKKDDMLQAVTAKYNEAAGLYLGFKGFPTESENKATAMYCACSSITHPSIASSYHQHDRITNTV